MDDTRAMAAALWAGLGGDPRALDRLTVTGPTHVLPSVFPVTAVAAAAVSVATLAAAELWRVRGAAPTPVAVDTRHATLACLSERFTQVGGKERRDIWGSVSGDYATRDGWIRIHAVFRRHRAAALATLGLAEPAEVVEPVALAEPAVPIEPVGGTEPVGPDEAAAAVETEPEVDRSTIRTAVARWEAVALEEAVYRAGGCAGALRSVDQWQQLPQAAVVGAQPLVGLTPLGRSDGTRAPLNDEMARPLQGMRILDLTRVIAGPVAARFLGAYGAEVLRVDPPGSDDHPQVVLDTTVGKRSAVVDLHEEDARRQFDALVRKADAVLCAYRPGALEELGYDPAGLVRLRPGLVVGVLSAYGGVGPWGGRRGFDSLVQMTTGLADAGRHATGSEMPVSLPCQLLDHATGYLLAAGVLSALTRRTAASRGGGWLVQASLARTACWLEHLGRSGALDVDRPPTELPDDLAVDLHGPTGHTRHIACPGLIVGAAPHWDRGPVPLGHDPAAWPKN